MTLNLDITHREEVWLRDQAAQLGLPPDEIVKQLIEAQMSSTATPKGTEQTLPLLDAKTIAAIALLDSWIEEGASADEGTKRQAEEEVEELKRNLNANRTALGERTAFP